MRPVQDWNKYVDMLGKTVAKAAPEPAVLSRGEAEALAAAPRRGRGPKREETREELLLRLLDPTLTLEETARILEVCPTTVRRYTNRGVLPHERSAGNQRRFKLSCVLEFHAAQQRDPQGRDPQGRDPQGRDPQGRDPQGRKDVSPSREENAERN